MTTQDHDELSAHAITTAYAQDAEQKLSQVRREIDQTSARLASLHDAEEVLTRILTGLRASTPAPHSEQQTSASAGANLQNAQAGAGTVDQPAASAHPRTEVEPRGHARSRRPARADKKAPTSIARRSKAAVTPSGKADSAATGRPSMSDQVVKFLTENTGPQKAAEITVGIFGRDSNPAAVNRVRTTAERLVSRERVEKNRQGSSTFYQLASTEAVAASELAAAAADL